MLPIKLIITTAGLAALTDAENSETDAIRITSVGLSNAPFDAAPTLTALPAEFKQLTTVGGVAASANVIHMTAIDATDDVYDLFGLGFYLADGTLFAAYAQETALFRKVSIADFLLAFDVTFDSATSSNIEFGEALFLNPPATETSQGVTRYADDDDADAAESRTTSITPFQLGRRLAALAGLFETDLNALSTWVQGHIEAIVSRTITGAGAAVGGGALSANRVIDVPIASSAEILAAVVAGKVLTPEQWGLLPKQLGDTGFFALPGGLWISWGTVNVPNPATLTVTMPFNFPTTVRMALLVPMSNRNDGDEDDETWWTSNYGSSGFTINAGSTNNLGGGPMGWLAIGD